MWLNYPPVLFPGVKNSVSGMNSHETRSSPNGSAIINDDKFRHDELIITGYPHQEGFECEAEERLHGNCSGRNVLGFTYSSVLQVC